MMDRRTFVTMAAGGLLAAPFAAEAQQAGKVYRIVGLWTNPSPQMEACTATSRRAARRASGST